LIYDFFPLACVFNKNHDKRNVKFLNAFALHFNQPFFLNHSKTNLMKTNIFALALTLASIAISSTSCKKENPEPEPVPTEGHVALEFDHKWGMDWAPFSMNTEMTHPGTGEKITFTTLRYYISNVKLKKEDGTWWSQPESYHLVTVDENTAPEFELDAVPVGKYTAIEYTIGVDSTRNVSGAQTGALAPSNGMFWSWLTGYIFIKAEGTSPESGSSNGEFKYHIGGFKNSNNTNAIRTTTVDFPGILEVKGGEHHAKVHFYVNCARFWHGGISLNDIHTLMMPGANALTLADNFQGAFIVHHIH
jgi:hypothetical protein